MSAGADSGMLTVMDTTPDPIPHDPSAQDSSRPDASGQSPSAPGAAPRQAADGADGSAGAGPTAGAEESAAAPSGRRRSRLSCCLGGCASALVALLVALLLGAWSFGPGIGLALNSKPFFLLPPSPSRYAEVALDVMEERGLYGDSEEFRAARVAAEEVAAQADDVSEVHPALEKAARAAGGKHSTWVTPAELAASGQGSPPDGAETSDAGGSDTGSSADGAGPASPTVESVEVGAGEALWATVPENDMADDGVAYADALAGGLLDGAGEETCGTVVDLRGNRGGDLGPMIAGLNPLLPDGELLGFEGPTMEGTVTLEGGASSGGGTPTTTEKVGEVDGPVVVLTDERTASSAEATLLAFRARDDVHVIGQPTAGAPSANQVITMPDGSRLLITVAGDRDVTGELHVDQPIAPDETTEPGAPTDQAAEDWLAAHGCG